MCCREEAEIPRFSVLIEFSFPPGPGSAKELIKSINEKFAGSAGWEGTESYLLFQYVLGFRELFSFRSNSTCFPAFSPPHSFPFVLNFDQDELIVTFPFLREPIQVPSYLLRVFMLRLLVLGPFWLKLFCYRQNYFL